MTALLLRALDQKGMNVVIRFAVCSLAAAYALSAIASEAPTPVSPSSDSGLAIMEARCPTYSWGAVDRATGYELRVEATATPSEPDSEARAELFRRTLPAGVTSWTPSIEQCLERGQQYLWSVRALLPDGGSEWSAPTTFEVNLAPSDEEFRQALQVINAYVTHNQAETAPGAALSSNVSSPRGGDFVVSGDGSATAPVINAGSFVGGSFSGDGSGLSGVVLNAGPDQDVTSTITFRNANFGLPGGATNLVNFEDSASFWGTTSYRQTSFMNVEGRYEFQCSANRNHRRVGDMCIEQSARGPISAADDAIAACASVRMALCPLRVIQACDVLNIDSGAPAGFNSCGQLTDSATGRIWTSTTSTNESGSSFSELLVYDGSDNSTFVGGSSGTTSANFFCCVSIPGQ